MAQCAAAIAEVDDAATRHAVLTEELGRAALERTTAAKRLEAAQVAAEAVDRFTKRLREVRVLAEAATSTRAAAVSALSERRRLRADLDDRTTKIAELEESVRVAADEQVVAREAADSAARGGGRCAGRRRRLSGQGRRRAGDRRADRRA